MQRLLWCSAAWLDVQGVGAFFPAVATAIVLAAKGDELMLKLSQCW
jgi:hypothetical protein